MLGLYWAVACSYCLSFLSCSSSELFVWIPMEATASSWFSIQGPTTLALAANCFLSLMLFCCFIISFCRVPSRFGTKCFTSAHLFAMSCNALITSINKSQIHVDIEPVHIFCQNTLFCLNKKNLFDLLYNQLSILMCNWWEENFIDLNSTKFHEKFYISDHNNSPHQILTLKLEYLKIMVSSYSGLKHFSN